MARKLKISGSAADRYYYAMVGLTFTGSMLSLAGVKTGAMVCGFWAVLVCFLFLGCVIRDAAMGKYYEPPKPEPAPVKTFDKTGWTAVEYQAPFDTARPIFVMRAEWDTTEFWADGWGVGKNPYMNIIGLYWKYADEE